MVAGTPSSSHLTSSRLFAAVAIYYGAISLLSHMSGPALEDLGFSVWDKAAHVVAYIPIGLLIVLGLARLKRGMGLGQMLCLGLFAVLTLGVLDELHQYFVPGRFSSLGDVIADGIGGIIGMLAAMLISRPALQKPSPSIAPEVPIDRRST
ncbi:MAG: VanZ family protein [Myxococcota bacterium]|nr:VanZ family protein [Myxococcota bacterium]